MKRIIRNISLSVKKLKRVLMFFKRTSVKNIKTVLDRYKDKTIRTIRKLLSDNLLSSSDKILDLYVTKHSSLKRSNYRAKGAIDYISRRRVNITVVTI